MRRPPVRLVLVLACALAALALPSTGAARDVSAVPQVPSLEPEKTQALWKKLTTRRIEFRPLEAQACRPLRGDLLRLRRLAPPRDDPRGEGVSLRAVLHLGAARRRGQDTAAARSGAAHPRARPGLPRAGRDPPHDLAEMGREHGVDLVPGRDRRATQDGRPPASTSAPGDSWAINEVTSAMRRGDGNSRANLREFLRGLYDAGGEGPPTKGVVWVVGIGQRVSERRDLQGPYPGVAPGFGVLVGRERVRQRLVAGGVRRHSQLRRARHGDDRPSRRARRLPAPRRPPGGRGRRRVRHGERVLRRHREPARERGVPVGLRVRLHPRRAGSDAALRLGAGLRAPEPQRALGAVRATTGGSRGHRGTPRRFPLPTGRR